MTLCSDVAPHSAVTASHTSLAKSSSVAVPPARPGGEPRPYQIMCALARAYRDKLNEALEVYQQEGEAPPKELKEVIERLNQLI